MDHQPHCQTHQSMLSCLETVVSDVHLDLTSIDTEVNKCLPANHQLPSHMVTPPFFKEPANNTPVWSGLLPVVAELTKTHPSTNHNMSNCTSCIPKLPSILLSLEREVDRHIQYINYINDKMSYVPMTTNSSTVSMVTSRSQLMCSSVSRSKIRTNPSLPVLQRSPKVLNLSIESCDITSVSQQVNASVSSSESSQNAPVQSGPPCLCCRQCFIALQWFSDSVCSKIQYLKDHCCDLQTKLLAELKEKEKELMVQLAQRRKTKQTVTNSFSRLEGLGLQGLSICSNIQTFEPVYSNQSASSYGNHTNTRYAADGQSCDEEDSIPSTLPSVTSVSVLSTQFISTTTSNMPSTTSASPTTSDAVSSTQSTTTTNDNALSDSANTSDNISSVSATTGVTNQTQSTSSEGAYSIATFTEIAFPTAPEVSLCSEPDVTQYHDNIYEQPIVHTQEAYPELVIQADSTPDIPSSFEPDSPMPQLLEFQRRRSYSMNQHNQAFNRDTFRQRSHTISNPTTATRKTMNNSGQYSTIDETPENNYSSPQTKPMLLHVKSDIGVTIPSSKPRKMKKSKSSIMVRATKLKNFITKTFKRKSWDGPATRKSTSSTSVQASSNGVQFFEYDFSDDDAENVPVNTTSHSLCDLSRLADTADTLASCVTGINNQVTVQIRSNTLAEVTFTTASSNDDSMVDQITKIEQHLATQSGCAKTPDNPTAIARQHTKHPVTSTACKPTSTKPASTPFSRQKNSHVQLYIPAVTPLSPDVNYQDLLMIQSSMDNVSCIEPVNQPPALIQKSIDPLTPEHQTTIDHDSSQVNDVSHDSSSRKRLMFDATTPARLTTESIYSFHDDSSFDIHQGYASFRKFQKIASTPCQPSSSNSTACKPVMFITMPGRRTIVGGSLPLQEPELLNHLCQGQSSLQSRQNMEKLCHLKPYLIQGKVTLRYLLFLLDNYPHNMTELPGYDHATKEISKELVFLVSSQTYKPHIFARNLVWRLFTLAELFGGKTDSLNTDVIIAVKAATIQQFNVSHEMWQSKCITFIHDSIKYLFRHKLRHPVFRSLLQQSDC